MTKDLRRSKREADYLPIAVHAVDAVDGNRIAGPFATRIIDISDHGACLLFTQVMQGKYHIFHSTQKRESTQLQLTIDLPPDLEQVIITAIPIWMHLFRHKEVCAYKIGIEFTLNSDDTEMQKIKGALHKERETRKDWWEGVSDLFQASSE